MGTDLRVRLAAISLLLVAPVTSIAGDIDYDARRAPELRRCDEDQHHGRVDAARRCYTPLLNAVNPLVRAEAAFALGDLPRANDLFRAAVAADPGSALARVRWGRFFAYIGLNGDAVQLYREALEIDEDDIGARAAMARLSVESFDGDIQEELDALLKDDANLVEAHLIASRLAIEQGRHEDAIREAQRAQALATQQKHPPIEALALLATAELVQERNPDAYIREALAWNPRFGDMFVQLGYFNVIRRLYKQADTWLQRAVEVEPDSWTAHRELGLNLMRLGRLAEARPHLITAFETGPKNQATENTLKLLDSLDKFDTLSSTAPALNLLLHKDELPTLGPYAQQLASSAVTTLSRRFGHTPSGPVTVEMYPNHDDFAVRIAGLPGMGSFLGVTFDTLVLMDSPSGRQSGDFHWGSVLWHEMAHVFSIGASQGRVPRWLGEGLSVYEEWTSGPTPGVNMTPDILDVFIAGKFLPVANLDDGFMRPTYENQVHVSYQQGGLVCYFIAQHWGGDRLMALLRSFDGKVTTADAIRKVFEIPPEEFDKQFNEFVSKRYAAYIVDPKRWLDLLETSHRLLDAHNWTEARDKAQAAITMFPEFTGGSSAYLVLAEALEGAGDKPGAIAALQSWRKAGGWKPDGLRKLGALLLEAKRDAEATEVLAAVNYADPLTTEGHDQLGQLLLAQNKGDAALTEYQVLRHLQPDDTAIANYGMARAYRIKGDQQRARRHLLESLETAPNYRPAQHLLLEMTGEKAQ